jgi:hypothetical protein
MDRNGPAVSCLEVRDLVYERGFLHSISFDCIVGRAQRFDHSIRGSSKEAFGELAFQDFYSPQEPAWSWIEERWPAFQHMIIISNCRSL